MSFFEKNSYSSNYIDKKESISDQDSPRRLKVALKFFRFDEKVHIDGLQSRVACTCNDHNEPTSNDVSAVKESAKSPDGIVPKDDDDRFCFDTEIFRIYCKCAECLQYREVLMQLLLEDHEYNTLWNRLKALIREFYDVIPQNPVPYRSSMDATYEELIESQARWFTDGHIDKQKNIQLSLSSQLPLTNEMTFILVFTMLYTRDPHQLFQLLCIQLRCISIAYSDGLKKMLKTNAEDDTPTYDPVELLTFILDGYDKFCSTAKKLSSLLFELQRDHLQRFLLSWTILNKRMYQRYVYMEIQELIPECILKLKDLLEPEEYSTMAHRLIRFDEDMTSTTKSWSDVWSLLQEYHMSFDDRERRQRISCIQNLLKAIRNYNYDFSPYEELLKRENSANMHWMKMENREEAWVLTVDYLKRVWQEKDDSRVYAMVRNDQCMTCDSALASHYADCDCVTCLFAGGPCNNQGKEGFEKYYCTKCSFYEKLDRDYMDYIKKDMTRRMEETSDKSLPNTDDDDNDDLDDEVTVAMLENHCYHLSWAVFKHLQMRKVYNVENFNARHFCSFQDPPCMRNECRVATHIIAGLYPLNFSKFLIKAYQPLKEEERKELMNIQKLYFSYLMQKISDDKSQKVDMLQQMDLLWNIDDAEYTLFCDIGSAFAECYLIDMPIPVQELLDSCFILDNGDIELNTYWLECIYMFKENDNSPLKKIENDPKVLEFQLRMQMDQISSLNDVGKFSAASNKMLASTSETKDDKTGKIIDTPEKDELEFEAKIQKKMMKFPESLQKLLDVVKNESKLEKKDEENASKECSYSGSAKAKKSVDIQKYNENISPSKMIREKKCIKHTICDKSDGSAITVADAVKIAVKQQLNQKLEAELKSLKKEHSVLKDMVRDLEQIKENDENQLISKKEKTSSSNNGAHHCCSEHSDMSENQQNHPKMCHRGDGQCTCYYCTIFGHTECNHGRTNETRDRLRKRLHQIHSKSSTKTITTKNVKNPPGALKKMLASKVTPTNCGAAGASGAQTFEIFSPKPQSSSKAIVEQKDNSTNESLEAALQDNFSKITGANNAKGVCSKVAANTTNTANTTINSIDPKTKKRKVLSTVGTIVANKTVPEHDCGTGTCKGCDGGKSKSRSETNSNSDGDSSVTRKAKSANAFANDDMASLDDILDFIEGNSTNKKDSQKKAAKKAKQKQKKEDIKRMEELEQLRDQFHEAFYKELDVKNELKILRGVKKRDKKKIAELETSIKKYGKFKSKIESNILELIGILKTNNVDFKFAYLPTKEQQQEKLQQISQGNPPVIAELIGDQAKNQNEKSNNVKLIQSDQRHETSEVILDQSKRMVTIRRINVPHAEPQVTVTAKGTSPDKDKLLYTFINGQLIPSANVSTSPSAHVSMNVTVNATANDKSVKTKQNLKPEPAKLSKKLTEPTLTDKNAKKNGKDKPTEKTTKANDKMSGRKSSPENSKTSKATTVTTANNTAFTKDKDKRQKKGKKDVDTDLDAITNSTKELTINEEKPKKEKKKVKAVKFEYADPNYKVNQFDLLDTDEDDGYYIESSSDESIDDESVPVAKPTTITKLPTPPLSNQSSVESQSAQTINKNAKNQLAAKNVKAVEINKKAKNDTNTKAQSQKTDRKSAVDTIASTKSTTQKPSNNLAQTANVSAAKQNPDDFNLSKKQKKKMEKKQNAVQQQKSSSSSKADADYHSMSSSMQRMHLDSDTKDAMKNSSSNKNVSIMDQLNRGVKVEGLTLPPGITLTRVDPTSAEGLRAKRDSIVSHPASTQYQQPMEYQRPLPFMSGMSMQSNGLIMVDPMQNLAASSTSAAVTTSTIDQKSLQQQNSKKSRKNRKKNKNKAEEENVNEQPAGQSKIVTLRNPLFQGSGDRNQPSMPLQQRNQVPLNINQPASIIKNENGMFTIRNMALHQALSNGVAQNYRLYSSEVMYQPQEMKTDNYSYFSGNANNATNATNSTSSTNSTNNTNNNGINSTIGQDQMQSTGSPKASATAIGSERLLRKQQQSYASMANGGDMFNSIHMDTKRSYSSFDMSGANYGFNSDFIGSAQSNASIPTTLQNQYYQHVNGGFSFNNQSQNDHANSLFGNRTPNSISNSHCCDDSPPTHDPYGTKTNDESFFKKFDEDPTFLHGLHSGQRLNSEVTIHNIHDPKFSRKSASINSRDGVEITRINGPDAFNANPNLAVGSQRPTTSASTVNVAAAPVAVNDDLNNSANSEFGENVFVPNSAINLNELETDEREIESFKRFNYYYEPPKNKPKVNLDVKGIVVAKKQPASNNSSPYFGDLAGSSSLSNTPRLEEDLYPELNAFKSNNCDHTTINRIHLDNFLHGIIGDEL